MYHELEEDSELQTYTLPYYVHLKQAHSFTEQAYLKVSCGVLPLHVQKEPQGKERYAI